MPKINIREIDNTGSASLNSMSNVVYIPGAASKHVEPILYTTAGKFLKAFIEQGEEGYDPSLAQPYEIDMSAKLAYHLLTLGMHVLYEGFVIESGATVPSIDWDKLADKSLYNIRFLTTGGYMCPSSKMIDCAAKRCDAVALVDSTTNDVSAARTFVKGILDGIDDSISSTKDPKSFGASFVPSWKGSLNVFGKITEVAHIPASFGYLIAFARSAQNNPIWYAVAGSFRGVIPELVDVDKKYSSAEIEMLQARAASGEVVLDDYGDNVGFAINPIAYVRPFGYIVWGNRTLRENEEDEISGTGILKATSFLNCRILSTEVAKALYNAARKYTFEQNSVVLWTNFKSEILPLLNRMESGNGILAYSIEKLPTVKKARLAARVQLTPIEGVEDFDLEIELTDSISVTE